MLEFHPVRFRFASRKRDFWDFFLSTQSLLGTCVPCVLVLLLGSSEPILIFKKCTNCKYRHTGTPLKECSLADVEAAGVSKGSGYLSRLTLARTIVCCMELDAEVSCVMQLHCHPWLDRWASPCCDDHVNCTHGCARPYTGAALGLRQHLGSQRRRLTTCLLSCFFFAATLFGVCVCDNVASGSVITETLQTAGPVQEDL